MKKTLILIYLALCITTLKVVAQTPINQIDPNGNVTSLNKQHKSKTDSIEKEIPKGIKVWTVDSRFGDRTKALPDTMPHMFMNSDLTNGLYGQYNSTGNLGSPRINRIFADRPESEQFIFTQPYDFFIVPVDKFLFTNTLSPFTNLTYFNCGNQTNGEDHFTAKFGVNAGKRIGVGFNVDYLYGRGFYQNQSTSHFNYTMYGSYMGDHYQAHLLLSTNNQKVTGNGGITNDEYITHPELFSNSFSVSEIPTVLSKNWNKNNNQHLFFTHRYSLGFTRKVKMTGDEIKAKKFAIASQKEQKEQKAKNDYIKQSRQNGQKFDEKDFDKRQTLSGRPDDAKVVGTEPTKNLNDNKQRIAVNSKAKADSLIAIQEKQKEDTSWLKTEYVPVTSFIHTLKIDNYNRSYISNDTPTNFYQNNYKVADKLPSDSINDKTSYYHIQNTFAISLLEGFNKWAKAGLKAFISDDFRHYTLPDSVNATKSYTENDVSIGAELSKRDGKTLHYNIIGETWLAGKTAGQFKIDANIDLNFPMFGDTVTLAANGFLHSMTPTFYFRHYHSDHLWWDNDGLNKIINSRIQGQLSYRKTRTSIRVAVDEVKNYTYFGQTYTIQSDYTRTGNTVDVLQYRTPISLITASLNQDFTLGPLNCENQITVQKSTKADVLPVPTLNIYTNLYLRFKIARVLKCDFGADMFYYTKYYAPDYSPYIGQYTVQTGTNKVQTGGYPFVDVYANFHLKHTRFFVMMSHVNYGAGSNKDYFITPHYPTNQRILRLGISWNFFN